MIYEGLDNISIKVEKINEEAEKIKKQFLNTNIDIIEKDIIYLLKAFNINPLAFIKAVNIPAITKLVNNKKCSPLNFNVDI